MLDGRLLAFVVTVFSVCALVVPAPVQATTGAGGIESAVRVPTASDQASARSYILKTTNDARAAAGLRPLSGDTALDDVAQSCSNTQAARESMAHCTGYHSLYPPGWTAAAENVATGYSVESVVSAWMNSPSHRANILRPDATHLGIGYALSASGRSYFTQNFATYPESVRPSSNPRFLRTAYDGAIWRVEGTVARVLSWQEWSSVGFPAWQPAPTDYVKYPWSNVISAVTFFGTDPSQWAWKQLDYQMWRTAGAPVPRNVGWIQGSTIHQWATGPDLFLTDVSGAVHKLTYPEWRDTGHRAFEVRVNQGYLKLSWDGSGTIGFFCDIAAGRGSRLTYSEWVSAGTPSPLPVLRSARDRVWRDGTGATIFYTGPLAESSLTYAQWRAMGAPMPLDARGELPAYACG